MTQTRHELSSILSWPRVYAFWSRLVGGDRAHAELVQRYLQVNPGDTVLDIGCGPAAILASLPQDISYVGFDPSAAYISRARALFGDRATFFCGSISAPPTVPSNHFDIVMALGVLHHLDDRQAEQLFALAHDALGPGGRFISFDPVLYVPDQSRIARWIILQDRGRHVRREAEHLVLAKKHFTEVRSSVRHDFIRIPYSHLFLECRKNSHGPR
jgi:SAM-dependent methyltransferase